MSERHLLIAGTGRAGTTALVELLDACGLETGSKRLAYFESAHGGLESRLLADHVPYVVKDPYLSEDLSQMIADGFDASSIDAILLPLRDLDDVVSSRIGNFASSGRLRTAGGLWRTQRPGSQKKVLTQSVHNLLLTAAEHRIQVLPLAYPRFVTDPSYAWACLEPVLGEIDREQFLEKHRAVMRPELVNRPARIGTARMTLLDLHWFIKKVRAHMPFLDRLQTNERRR